MSIDAHEYDMKGPFKIEGVETLPSWSANDEKRLIYTIDDNKFYLGLGSAWQEIEFTSHALGHISSSDKINGDRVEITYSPSHYTPSGGTIRGHLYGMDTEITKRADKSHASTHIKDGSDEIDGDKLNIDFTPSYYTPDTSPSEASNADDLTAHLKGIDTEIGLLATGIHASTHVQGQSDFIDGDKLDIDWYPTYYTPSTSPSGVDSSDHLTAHLAGIDNKLADIGIGDICGWVNFYYNGSSITIRDSYNVDSVVRNSIGNYTITWTTDFANTNYAVMGCSSKADTDGAQYVALDTQAVGTTIVTTHEAQSSSWGDLEDATMVCCVLAIGDQ